MPIDTSMYPIRSNSALLQSKPMDELVQVPTAKEIIDLAVRRTDLEGAKIRNRLDIMSISDKEKEQKDEVDRRNYLLNIGKPAQVPMPGGGQPPAPVPNQNALTPEWKGVPYPVPETNQGNVQPTPGAPVGSQPGNPATAEIPGEVSGPKDVQSFLSGADLPKPRSYGEFVAQQQLLGQRRAQFDEGHKRAMSEFKPLYESIIASGDNEAKDTLFKAASKSPYLTGIADFLKDVKLTGPGETEMTSNLNQKQLDHLKTIAATPELEGIIRNAPPGTYKVKTKHGKVVSFDVQYEKSETAEMLARRAVQEEKAAKGDTSPVTAQEIIKKMQEVKGESGNKTPYQLAKDVVKERLKSKGIDREPTATEIEQHMRVVDKEKARATLEGRIDPQTVEGAARMLIAGEMAPSQVKNTFGAPIQIQSILRAKELDSNYNAEEAESNYVWYKNNQRLIRRTESMIDPKYGAISEAIRLAKQVDQPGGTPLNKLTGKVGVALGNSRRQVFDLANSILAEEGQQVFGSAQGGEKFLALAQSLTDPNLSVEQYINAAKEMRFMILTRQMANVRGTPAQKVYDEAFKLASEERPFLTEKEKKETKESKTEKKSLSRADWVKKAKELNPGLSLDALNKKYDEKYGKK